MSRSDGMTAQEEMAVVVNMLARASEYRLQVEVVLELFRAVKANPRLELRDAVFLALGEWDV